MLSRVLVNQKYVKKPASFGCRFFAYCTQRCNCFLGLGKGQNQQVKINQTSEFNHCVCIV